MDTPTRMSLAQSSLVKELRIAGDRAEMFCPHIYEVEAIVQGLRDITDSLQLLTTPSFDSIDRRPGLWIYWPEGNTEKYVVSAQQRRIPLLQVGIPLTRAEGRFSLQRVRDHPHYYTDFAQKDKGTLLLYDLLRETFPDALRENGNNSPGKAA